MRTCKTDCICNWNDRRMDPREMMNIVEESNLKLIGIDGYWYDITKFITHHPGGDLIEKFVGKDATAVFHAFHQNSIIRNRKPFSKMKAEDDGVINKEFTELRCFFEKNGYFNVSYKWYIMKFSATLLTLLACVLTVTSADHALLRYASAVLLAAFWQQCGFFMHDFEHSQFTGCRHLDNRLGTLFGTLCFGISGSWWRDEHFVHHALTNIVDYDTQFHDPQMKEPIWAQSKMLWPFYRTYLEYVFIKIQHITFIPVCVAIGRLAILFDSMKQEKNIVEWVAFFMHWMLMLKLLSYFEIKEAIIFYGIAAMCQGLLHIQLLISHYAKPFHELNSVRNSSDWYRMQVNCNIDIENPAWLDWFHGGLNFHLVHHIFPRMPRHNYRRATEHLKSVCKKLDLPYHSCSWSEAVILTLDHLKCLAQSFTLGTN